MKINFASPILDRRGQPMQAEGGDLTLGLVCVLALDTGAVPGEAQLGVVDKRRWAKLSDKLFEAGELDIEEKDYVLIRQRIGKAITSPPVCDRALALLDAAKDGVSAETKEELEIEGAA